MTKIERSSALLREHYLHMTHKSGLPIYVFPKKMTTAYACFAVRYGSQNGTFIPCGGSKALHLPDGVAHFLEHKLFENEDGSDAFAGFAALGADANAYTSYDRTVYLCSCTEHFEAALGELLRFVTHPHFTKESVKKEQGIIAEEIRMYDDNPWERCFQNLLKGLYHRHPVRKSVCGSIGSIKKITPELLYECYHSFYTAPNMVLVVCGDVDAESVWRVVNKDLPDTYATQAPPACTFPKEPDAVSKPYTRMHMRVAKPIYCIGIKDNDIPASAEARLRRDLCRDLLDEILFSPSGCFYNDLLERSIINSGFSSGCSSGENFAFYCIEGEADSPETVFEELQRYLDRVCKEGISDEDFERAKRVSYADEICAYDSTEEIATRLLSFALDGTELFSCPEILQSITKDELEQLLRNSFLKDRFSMSVVYPTAH